jgi:glyoxylase-like metal-dependent hydrolase (beta-lactamase superfamily II)
MTADPRQGDAVYAVVFSDYRRVRGLRVPHALELRAGAEEDVVLNLGDVTVNPPLDEARFGPPEGVDPAPHPPAFRPRAVADGVFALRLYSGPANSYNSLLVQLEDQTVVVEPVLVDLFARPVTSLARRLAEDKPIRWVVATHHHWDHIGGARGYLASGARLATTPHGAEVVRRMASTRSTLTPNPVAGRDVEGQLVEVRDRLTLGTGSRTVELFRVAPSTHAEEMLLVYVPHARTVYVADLFAVPETGIYPPTPLTRHFARALDDLDLDVETIVPAHGLVGTRADLDRALADDPRAPSPGAYGPGAPGSR